MTAAAVDFDPMQESLPGALARFSQVLGAVDRVADEPLWPLADDQVEHLLGLIGWVRHRLGRLEAHAVKEGMDRGLPGAGGFTPVNWVLATERELTQAPTPAHAAQVVRLAGAQSDPALEELIGALEAGELSAAKAEALTRFHTDVKGAADPDSLQTHLDILLEGARDSVIGAAGDFPGQRVHGLSDKELRIAIQRTARMVKPARDLQRHEDQARAGRSLYSRPGACGGTEYTLNLDPEGAAVLDAALSALSAPQTSPDGTPDPRPAPRRRADALVEIIRRGTSAPGELPRTEKAQVMVTLSLTDLMSDLHGAGVSMTGQVLSPDTVRKLACDAGIVPVVLGTQGEVLDLGVPRRLFPPGMRKALWLRDQGCTFPGCTVPAQWCDSHHVKHWVDGGPTTLANGALLCARHHTPVHRHKLTATVHARGVLWHV